MSSGEITSNLNLIYILKVLAFEQEMKHYTNAKKNLITSQVVEGSSFFN